MKRIALISYGCAKNLVDSEVMLGHMEKAGYSFVTDPEDADILILNTCGFIEPARKEAQDGLKAAVTLKKKEKEKKIIAVGCYVERYKSLLHQEYPEIDAWLGVKDFDKIVSVIEDKEFTKSQNSYLYDHTTPRFRQTPPSWSYVKISEGCSHECSFCSIPLIKGPYRSRPINSVVQEVKALSAQGVKEVNLISQDTTYFGRDIGLEYGLTQLLQELLKIKRIEWIRILYGYPEEITDSLIEILQEDRICSYLDVPFQHSDANIIKKMKRAMDGKRALALIAKLRNKIPDIALRTSLVVGFPGEGKKEFEDLKNFVREARFDHLGVFTYSREEDTSSFGFGDPVKESVKNKRKTKILEIQADISFQKNEKYFGRQVETLIEGASTDNPDVLVGRAKFQAPEVDGVILIERTEDWPKIVNSIQKVEIAGWDVYDLYGKLAR